MIDEKKFRSIWEKLKKLEQDNLNTDSKEYEMVKKVMKIIGEEVDKCY